MENHQETAQLQETLEDPLHYLPCSTISQYRRRQTIYGENQPSASIYLVMEGKVKVCRLAENGNEVLMDIYRAEEFFGETAFLGISQRGSEISVAVENAKVMSWTIAQIEDLVTRRPKLAIALLHLSVQRSFYFGQRIESFAVDNISRRLVRALLHFSERTGLENEAGSVHMEAITHELLGQYVGTSREIVTLYMNQFRRQGYLLYSRKGIVLHREMLRGWLNTEAVSESRSFALAG